MESNKWWWDLPVSKIPFKKPVILSKGSTCDEAVKILRNGSFHQMPMVDADGNVTGFVTLEKLLSSLIAGEVSKSDPAEKTLIKQFRKVATATTLGRLSRMLQKDLYAVVLDEHNNGALIGILTQIDLLNFICNETH